MATLIELDTIEKNSRKPVEPQDSQEIVKARELRSKIRIAALKVAYEILVDPTPLPETDTPEPGSPEQLTRTERLERIVWARQTVQSPDGEVDRLLRLKLVGAEPAETPDDILAAEDADLQSEITPLVPVLARGLQVIR